MSTAKKLNTVATAPARFGDKVVTVKQDGTIGLSEIGFTNWSIPMLVDCTPLNSEFINGGYVHDDDGEELQKMPKGILRYLLAKYNSRGVFIGSTSVSVYTFFIATISSAEATDDGLPKYASGFILIPWAPYFRQFGTYNGTYYFKDL